MTLMLLVVASDRRDRLAVLPRRLTAVFARWSPSSSRARCNPAVLSRLLSIEPLPWIGRLSYGLYLWHWPITVWIVPARVHLGPGATNLLRLVLTFVAASLSFYLVEKPIRQRKWRPLTTLAVFTPAIGVDHGSS